MNRVSEPRGRAWLPALPRLGLRDEVLIVFPVAALLLVVLAAFTVFAYRDAVERIAEERREEAIRLARKVAEQLEQLGDASQAELRSLPIQVESLALYGRDGRLESAQRGRGLPPPILELSSTAPSVSGPSRESPGRIVAVAPVRRAARPGAVRVELEAAAIWAASSSLRVLLPVVLGLAGGVSVLVVLFLGRLLAPYDSLILRARQAGLLEPGDPDEMAALVRGFERAVASLHAFPGDPTPRESGGEPSDAATAIERALATELEAGLLLVDPQGRLLGINPEGRRLLGVDPAPGVLLSTLLAEIPDLERPISAAVAADRSIERTEVTVRRRDTSMTLGLALHPLRRRDGRARGYLALFSDVTEFERRAAERRMSEGLAQLGELSAGVAHELRNSLGVLRGYLDLLRNETDLGVAGEYREELLGETERLQGVVDDFLAFARPGGSRSELVDLAAILQRVSADPALASSSSRPELPSPLPPLLRGDSVLFERAVRNLVRNAAEFHPRDRGPLRLVLEPIEGGWSISIEDRGPGLPAAVRERLFQPFTSGRPGGTGLGLALSYRLVSLHGGTLAIEERPGGGTAAVIRLPADAFVTAGNAPAANAPAPSPSPAAETLPTL